jgi:glycosidase
MKKILCCISILAIALSCIKMPDSGGKNNGGNNNNTTSEKLADITYQLLIYSFADSDGDGVGDFKGIQNKLDYLESLGVSALWLSPAHPTSSYHAYDVNDYYSLNPLYAVGQKTSEKAEADFKELLAAAHAKGIAIYMDYVLNHSGKNNPWFQEAVSNPSSKYRDYYFFSANPSSDYKNFPMLKGTSYNSGEWKQVTGGSPKLTINKTSESVTNGTESWNMYMWDGSGDKTVKFVSKGDGTYYLVMDINGAWGMLVRKYANWDAGSKFGAKTATTIQEGVAVDLVADGADMSFTGNGRYKIQLTDVSTETLFYMGCFSDWMPDLNYGDVSVAENNPCFKDLAASADKWLNMGVDGFRLDAVKHICGGIGSYNNTSNQTLLKKWYDHCNATYKAAGHTDDIFMVAEAWDGHNIEKQYYKSLTSCFEFDFGYKLRDAIKGVNANGFATAVGGYVSDHTAQRPDAITSFFLSNHDQNRFSSEIGRNLDKQKLAAAVLLTVPGRPFIYQGEELGYWGVKDSGDEYVRTPILWDKAGTQCAKKGVNNKVDNSMLTSAISVEAQEESNESILNVYRKFAKARNSSKALASGTIKEISSGNAAVALWEMSCSGEKVIVAHNFGGASAKVQLSGYSTDNELVSNGTVTKNGNGITLAAYSSVVYKQ